jgi:CubicO group peptidase (beta-lactamase class C family)
VGVVRDGRLVHFTAHGLADVAGKRQITQDTVFRIASIAKTFTAVAVMQLWEQGLVDLDAPANDYLRGYELVPAAAGHRPATVRQLLTHTAGVPQMVHLARVLTSGWFGESFGLDEPLPTLAEYYQGRLRLAMEPGTTFTYSDHGFATLGQIVEDVSREPLDAYFRHRIRTDVAHHPEIWKDLCGWYKPRAQRTDMQAWSMTGAGAEVLLRGGRPVLRVLSPIPALYRGFPLHPDDADDPYLYRIDLSQFGLGTARVAFGRDLGGGQQSAPRPDPVLAREAPGAREPTSLDRRWCYRTGGCRGRRGIAASGSG